MKKIIIEFHVEQCNNDEHQRPVNTFFEPSLESAQAKVKELKSIDMEAPDRPQYLYNIEMVISVCTITKREWILKEASKLPF